MKILFSLVALTFMAPALAQTLADRVGGISPQTPTQEREDILEELATVPADQIAAVAAAINGLVPASFEILSPALASMNQEVFTRIEGRKFTAPQLTALGAPAARSRLQALTTTARTGQIATLPETVIIALSAETLSSLQDTQLQALTPMQISATSPQHWTLPALRDRLKALPASSFQMTREQAQRLQERLTAGGVDLATILAGDQLAAWRTALGAPAARTDDRPEAERPAADAAAAAFSGRGANDCTWVTNIPRRVVYANEPSCGRRNNPIKTCVGYVSCAGAAGAPRLIRMTTCSSELCQDDSAAGALRCTQDQTRYSRQPSGERGEPAINIPGLTNPAGAQ
jgi:hypothetical protein